MVCHYKIVRSGGIKSMSCKCASWDSDRGNVCSVTGDGCMFVIPNEQINEVLWDRYTDKYGDIKEIKWKQI